VEAGVRPQTVVGDFDSQNPDDLPADWSVVREEDQNSTDFEKALSVVPDATRELVILGGLGRRLDHTLTNLLIATEIDPSIRIHFSDTQADLFRITPDTPWEGHPPTGSCISLIPLQEAAGAQTAGLQWNLNGCTMGSSTQLGQSNRVEGPVRISITSGTLWLWLGSGSND
jgi:thiamine pyrophosphokinase